MKKKKTGEKQLNIGEKEFIIVHSTKKGGNYHDNFQRYDNRRITPCG